MSKKQIAREIGKARMRGDHQAASAWRNQLKHKHVPLPRYAKEKDDE